MSVRPRRAGESGFTLVTVMGTMLIASLLTIAAFAAVNGDARESGKDIGRKQALAAAEAGVNEYLYRLNQDNGYWAKCTNVPAPAPVNDAWDGTLPDPRKWRNVPNSAAQYTIELLPVAPYKKCTPGDEVTASMIDRSSRTLRIRVTGRVPTANGMDYRSIIAAVKRDGFLDFLYFTDYETSDAVWYSVTTDGRPTAPTGTSTGDVISWAANNCNKTYWRDGRGSLKWTGKYTDATGGNLTVTCTQIQFANKDVVAGPLHTNDDLYTCDNPTFGRNAQDRIESGDGYRTACGASSVPNFKGTFLKKQKVIGMPATNAQLASVAGAAYRFAGAQRITLNAANMTVQALPSGAVKTVSYPSNGVLYVSNSGVCPAYQALNPDNNTDSCGNVRLSGTYGADLTIATENDIIIDGDVTRSGDAMLGLIANQFIRVANPSNHNNASDPSDCDNIASTANRTIEAAILSLQHSFTVDNYYRGHPIGTLTVKGVIAQRFRGPVGTGGASGAATGYIKDYQYDDRLAYRSPPNFLDPVQSAWRIARYTEQAPARGSG
jgi:Tfp pilus assembly protein PilX